METPEDPKPEEKEDWEKSLRADSPPTWWRPDDTPPAPPAEPAQPVAPAASPVRDPELTLHLERSAIEATEPAPPDSADYRQQTMAMPARPEQASVSVRSGPDTGAQFTLETSPIYVGRAPDNGIVLNDPATSRRHARFERRGQDYLIVDLGSANGTLVDSVRVVEQVLVTGTVVTMGQNELVVTIS